MRVKVLCDAHQNSLGSKDIVKKRFDELKFKPMLMRYESLDDLKALQPTLLKEQKEIYQEVVNTKKKYSEYIEKEKNQYKSKVDSLIKAIEAVQGKLDDLSSIKVDKVEMNKIFNTLDYSDMKTIGVFDDEIFHARRTERITRKRSLSFNSFFECPDNNQSSSVSLNDQGSTGSLAKYCELRPEYNKQDQIKRNFDGWLYVLEVKLQLQKDELLRLSSYIEVVSGSDFNRPGAASRLDRISDILKSICKAFKGVFSCLRAECRFKFDMKEDPFAFYGAKVEALNKEQNPL